ncbi:hypothetical protein ACFYOV_28505 [Streptomyces sp. NPDC005931]|uniref:hypothetical protein n=1 Tax=Streptomyces sp. NPDC005931 TaxID=3364737 RepID=UPI0036762347
MEGTAGAQGLNTAECRDNTRGTDRPPCVSPQDGAQVREGVLKQQPEVDLECGPSCPTFGVVRDASVQDVLVPVELRTEEVDPAGLRLAPEARGGEFLVVREATSETTSGVSRPRTTDTSSHGQSGWPSDPMILRATDA